MTLRIAQVTTKIARKLGKICVLGGGLTQTCADTGLRAIFIYLLAAILTYTSLYSWLKLERMK